MGVVWCGINGGLGRVMRGVVEGVHRVCVGSWSANVVV